MRAEGALGWVVTSRVSVVALLAESIASQSGELGRSAGVDAAGPGVAGGVGPAGGLWVWPAHAIAAESAAAMGSIRNERSVEIIWRALALSWSRLRLAWLAGWRGTCPVVTPQNPADIRKGLRSHRNLYPRRLLMAG